MMSGFPSPGGGGFEFMSTLFPIFFIIVLGLIIFSIIRSGARYVSNASSPRKSIYATIISKRMDVQNHAHTHAGDNMHTTHSSRTYYYITLQFDNGERKEYLDVKNIYGLVAEGDIGYAATQGDWIVAFERDMQVSPGGSRF
ncbi:DUF2500 domain-containing protein [Paenibacillus segetis]|nr:DUF2500 domain-containing protein [Paenibacillus segetis]